MQNAIDAGAKASEIGFSVTYDNSLIAPTATFGGVEHVIVDSGAHAEGVIAILNEYIKVAFSFLDFIKEKAKSNKEGITQAAKDPKDPVIRGVIRKL